MQCLVSEDKFEVIQMERSLTIAKCVSAPLLINQKAGENELIKSIFLIIRRFNDLVNVSRKMNEDQMIALAADFYERFSGESLEDVMLFFKMARNGDFGDIYRLDSIVILAWVPQYLEKKIEAFHDSRVSEENARIRAENDAVQNHEYSDKSVEMLEELSRRLKTATVSRNTGVMRKDNPLFDYSEYLRTLPETIQNKDDDFVETMIGNTSKYTHPDVFNIIQAEKQRRKDNGTWQKSIKKRKT